MEKALSELVSTSGPVLRTLLLYALLLALLTPQLISLFSALAAAKRSQRRIKRLHTLSEVFKNIASEGNPEPAKRLATLLEAEITDVATLIAERKKARRQLRGALSTPWLFLLIALRAVGTSTASWLSIMFLLAAYGQFRNWQNGTNPSPWSFIAVTSIVAAILISFVLHHAPRLLREAETIVKRIRS